ncbi:hypothetical protein [Flavobacterium sp.]|uniref:hypothetical protein n=1 Tax=Flavobacterium sp. TaxID=239 RepID=UPI002609B678|nr:hypothetical protein [Flavobacterium sp.]
MRILRLLLVTTLFFEVSLAQETSNRVDLDSLGNETSNKYSHYYLNFGKFDDNKQAFEVTQYLKNGTLYAKGWSKSEKFWKKTGEETTYFGSGEIKSIRIYSDTSDSSRIITYYETGAKKLEGTYEKSDDDLHPPILKTVSFWDKSGKQLITDGKGIFEDNNDNVIEKGQIVDGFQNGNWIRHNLITKERWIKLYKMGKFVSGIYIDAQNKEHKFSNAIVRPQPPGGTLAFNKYLASNFKVRDEWIGQGKIITQFVVDIDGSLVDIKVLKKVAPDIEEEIMRLLKKAPRWVPAEMYGKKIRALYTLPITIR